MTSYIDRVTLCVKAILRVVSTPASICTASALALFLISIGINGCSNKGYSNPAGGTGLTGSVIGGQNPVTASAIQLYAVGTTGDGSAATPLIGGTVTTSDGSGIVNGNANSGNANNTLPAGSFTITGDYTCPTASSEVYLVSKGGNPGLGTGVNANLTLMTGLGQCGSLSSSTFVVVNELTTVSTLAALSNFATAYSALGSGSSDTTQLQSQFSEVNEYTNTANGAVPGPTLPAGYSASSTAIQTLGDIVAACVNSPGGVAGDNSACGNLFILATISGSPAPTDTVGAIINILNQPTVNAAQIFALLPATNPFEPTLSSAPAGWQLPITSSTATQLAFTVGPSNTAAGASISPVVTVTIENASNAPQTSATNAVTLAIGANPSGGTLSGTTTVNAVNGVATFTGLSINKTGTGYTLAASAAGLTGTPSGSFNITPGSATKLAFGVQPPAATPAGSAMNPAVTVLVEDANSNTVTTSTATVNMAIGTNPGSGTLSGTSANAVAGVATFSASSINNVGTGYTLAASSTGLTGATSNTFNITASAISVGATTVGNNLFTNLSGMSLPGVAPATEFLTLTSNDPTHFLLSTSSTVAGSASIQIQLTSGSSSIPGTVYIQGQNYTGTAAITSTITASASGFSNGTGNLTLYPSGLGFNTSSFSTTTQASPTSLTIGLNLLNPGTLTYAGQGNLGPQAPTLSFSVASGTTATGTITGSPTTFPGGGAYYNTATAFKPAGAGTSTLTITEPSGYSACSCSNWPLSITATVTAPTINPPTNTIVGNNLITSFSISLQTAPATSDTFTITSSDPTHLSLSTTPGAIGSASVSSTVGAGGGIPTIYLEGQNYSGTTAITANLTVTDSLGAYTSGSGTLSLYPSGLGFNTSSFSTTTQASPTSLTVGLNALTPGTLTFAGQGNLGPQAPTLSFSVASGTTATGTITGSPTTFPYAAYYNTATAFKPAGAGTSTLTLTQPSGYSTCSCSNWPISITATVTAPTINAPSNTIVGNNLITNFSISLQTAPTASDTFTITSSDPTHLSLSLTAGGIGSASVSPTVGAGGSIPTIYLEGQNYSGTTAITANLTVTDSLNAYTPGSGTLTLYPSGLGFNTSSFSTTTFSSPTSLTVGLNVLTPNSLTFAGQGNLGPQAPTLSFSVASGTTSTGTITGSPTTFPYAAYYNQSTAFVPAGAGTSTITITQPSGYYTCSCSNWPLSITATVSAPTITVNPTTVGNNLIQSMNIGIQSGPLSTETMTITSNDPTHFLLSTSPTVVGSASVTVQLTAGSGSVPSVYLQGQNFNNNSVAWTTSVTATAPGYTGGSGTQTLYPSGLGFNNNSFSVSKSGGAVTLTVGLNLLNPSTLTFAGQGVLGPQGASPTFTITSGTPATGTITGNPGTYTVNGGTYSQNTSFQPVAVGTSVLTINEPTGYNASTSPSWPSQITATVGP